jgi:hypothetical protein
MITIGLSNKNASIEEILSSGYDLAFTSQLNDMTDPAKTIYTITGADYVNTLSEAKIHGYLDQNGNPLENNGKYPIAINSELYMEHFKNRLAFLKEYTKWPYGLHIGGSKSLIENTYPLSKLQLNGYWCYGFRATHLKDPEDTLAQYQLDVWESIINELIEIAKNEFPKVKLITTGFHCPVYNMTKKGLITMTAGSEPFFLLKRMSLIHKNWYNIFFDLFNDTGNINEEKLIKISSSMNSYSIRNASMICINDVLSLFANNKTNICTEAKTYGAGYLAYILGIHGGILIKNPVNKNVDVKSKLDTIKKYNTQ